MVFPCATRLFSICIVSQGTKRVIYVEKIKVVSVYNAAIVYCMLSIYVLCTHDQKVYCILE